MARTKRKSGPGTKPPALDAAMSKAPPPTEMEGPVNPEKDTSSEHDKHPTEKVKVADNSKLYFSTDGEGKRLQMAYAGIEVKFERGYYRTAKEDEQNAIKESRAFKLGLIREVPESHRGVQKTMVTGVISSVNKAK